MSNFEYTMNMTGTLSS